LTSLLKPGTLVIVDVEHIRLYLDLGGDILTYLGGMTLAREVWNKWKEFVNRLVIGKLLAGSAFSEQGVTIRNEEDLELVQLRASRVKVATGCCLITLGFVLTVWVRVWEVLRT
jgi:hypothetical protein